MKKFFALFFAIIVIFTIPTNAIATEVGTHTQDAAILTSEANDGFVTASSTYIMATYYDTNFYLGAVAKTVTLEKYCVSITYRCTTQNNTYDSMLLFIHDLNGGGYDKTIDFIADGASHTMSLYLPAGNYNIQLFGSLSTYHLVAAVNFYGYV